MSKSAVQNNLPFTNRVLAYFDQKQKNKHLSDYRYCAVIRLK